MLKIFSRLFGKSNNIVHASERPGQVFPMPKGWRFEALDDVVIALPLALLADDEVIGSVIESSEDAFIHIPIHDEGEFTDLIQIKLSPGQWVKLSKSCEAFFVANDANDTLERRMKVNRLQ